jgi:hypothetical protein
MASIAAGPSARCCMLRWLSGTAPLLFAFVMADGIVSTNGPMYVLVL